MHCISEYRNVVMPRKYKIFRYTLKFEIVEIIYLWKYYYLSSTSSLINSGKSQIELVSTWAEEEISQRYFNVPKPST